MANLDSEILDSATELGWLKGISYAYLNIRSLFKSLDEVKVLLSISNLDLLLLGETFLTNHVSSDVLQVDGYDLYHFKRDAGTGARGGGGFAIYVRQHYNFSYLDEWSVCSPDVECM